MVESDEIPHVNWWKLHYTEQREISISLRSVNFSRFSHILKSGHKIKPLQKFIDAVLKFSALTTLTDVRSSFGLVNQVSHYDRFSTMM